MENVLTHQTIHDEELLQEGSITITRARIQIEQTSHAVKYLATVTHSETHPPRGEAKFAFGICLFALLVLIVYLILGKVSLYGFLVLAALVIIGATIAAVVLWLHPSNYELDLTMINGEKVKISNASERHIQRVHNALKTAIALNRQDQETENGSTLDIMLQAAGQRPVSQ